MKVSFAVPMIQASSVRIMLYDTLFVNRKGFVAVPEAVFKSFAITFPPGTVVTELSDPRNAFAELPSINCTMISAAGIESEMSALTA
jgi:hypothetical protein